MWGLQQKILGAPVEDSIEEVQKKLGSHADRLDLGCRSKP